MNEDKDDYKKLYSLSQEKVKELEKKHKFQQVSYKVIIKNLRN